MTTEINLSTQSNQASRGLGKLSDAAKEADSDLSNLAESLNAVLNESAKAAGKKARLFDLSADRAALLEIKQMFGEIIAMQANRKGTFGQQVTVANAKTAYPKPDTPSKVNISGITTDAKQQKQLMDRFLLKVLENHAKNGETRFDSGLSLHELNRRSPLKDNQNTTGNPSRQPQNGGNGGREEPKRNPVANAVKMLAQKFGQGTGSVMGGAGAEIAGGAARGMAGMLPGGMLGGGLLGLAGYGALKGAQAIGEGIDRNKDEAIGVDVLKRQLGTTSDSFDQLKASARLIGDSFDLTYEASRKLSAEFLDIARISDRMSAASALGQAREGAGIAQAVGLDEAQGAGFMATLRHSGAMGETQKDARIMGVQFAEALKRSGSTMNAGDLMHAMQSFSENTAHRGLTAPNVEGFAGMLSAMVGSKTPGMDVGNAAGILNQADASFQHGGAMGEASNTLQFMGMGGSKIGILGVKARQSAGMFATENDVFGGKNNPLAQYMGNDLSQFKTGSNETGLESTMRMFDANFGDKQSKLLAMGNHFGLDPKRMAALYNMREQGSLHGTLDMVSSYNERRAPSEKIDMEKLSATGYTTLADISQNKSGVEGLQNIREGLSKRTDLSIEQRQSLTQMTGDKNEASLKDSLTKFAATLQREKTDGEKLQEATAKTANAAQRMADGMMPAVVQSRDFLGALVEKLAPDSEQAKASAAATAQAKNFETREKVESGKLSSDEIAKKNKEFDKRADAEWGSFFPSEDKVRGIERERVDALGAKAIPYGKYKRETDIATGAANEHQANSALKFNQHMLGQGKNIPVPPQTPPTAAENATKLVAEKAQATGNSGKSQKNDPVEEAIAKVAKEEGVNPDYLRGLAQLETQKGKKTVKGDGVDTYNLGNIKATKGEGGIRAYDAREGSNDAYKQYGSYEESVRDKIKFLKNPRYKDALQSKTPEEFAQKLKDGGYATAPNYATALATTIHAQAAKPYQIPDGNPQEKAASQKAAEAQRLALQVSPIHVRSSVELGYWGGEGRGRQSQTINSESVTKPRAVGMPPS